MRSGRRRKRITARSLAISAARMNTLQRIAKARVAGEGSPVASVVGFVVFARHCHAVSFFLFRTMSIPFPIVKSLQWYMTARVLFVCVRLCWCSASLF